MSGTEKREPPGGTRRVLLRAAALGAVTAAGRALAGPATRAAAAPAAAGAAAAAPRPLMLPAHLRARLGRAEASGIAWAEALDRYLVVIDDTIDNEENDLRAPMVLAMDRAGRFDDTPVPLAGIEHLDDAESICAAGAQRFFLLTSHAPNRHGRVRASRRQLLDLQLDGRVLRVARGADLSQGKGGVPRLLRSAELGVLDPEARFDAEAIAFHEGALYVGLKAPLAHAGASALVLQIADPDGAFDRGRIHKGHLDVWAELRLAVTGPGGAPVGQGIFDMLFADDGTMYLTANAPKGGPPDGGGALWRVRTPRRSGATPELLQRFAGLKPEGLSLAPDGATLTLVFDRDDATPLWTSWRLG